MDDIDQSPNAATAPEVPTEGPGSRLPSLPLEQPTATSIDLTGDSDGEGDTVKAQKQRHSQTGQHQIPPFSPNRVGLNGSMGTPGMMNGNSNGGFGNGNASPGMGFGRFSQTPGQGPEQSFTDYRPFFSSGPLQHPHSNNGGPSHHPPNPHLNGGNGMSTQPPSSASPSKFHPPYNGSGSSSAFTARGPVPSLDPTHNGSSSSAAIDITSDTIPSPPKYEPKQPIFIGAITTECFMLYPTPVVYLGGHSQDPNERLELAHSRGAEFLKVKLKFRKAGSKPKHGSQWTMPTTDVIQVFTPDLTTYVGEIQTGDTKVESLLCQYMSGGLCRLEGYIMRLQHDMPAYRIRVNVMFFTLPANIDHFSRTLEANNLYLFDPVPSYDPNRHVGSPPYHNPHGGGQLSIAKAQAARMLLPGSSMMGNGYYVPADRINQKEVTRQQVDAIYSSVQTGGELEHSDPGPNIKTDLFPHQKKALTFLLEREQDAASLKKARKFNDRAVKKALAKLSKKEKGKGKGKDKDKDKPEIKGDHGEAADGEDGEDDKENGDGKDHETSKDSTPADEDVKKKLKTRNRSLWKPTLDAKGKIRSYRHKITNDEIQVKKGDPPPDCKGAILADDMGLGKTLSIVSLIAATRQSAMKWSRTDIAPPPDATDSKPELDPNTIKTKVFGMPDIPEPEEKVKKRKRDDEPVKLASTILRSRGTLLVCPMSTISNWEDQIREHWNGDVEVIGGASGQMLRPPEKTWKVPKRKNNDSTSSDEDEFDALKIYIYHGPSRCPDPNVIADFDIVITSYNTLANEYSKSGGASCEDTPADTACNSDDEFGDSSLNSGGIKPEVEAEIKANEVADALRKKKKGAKGSAVKPLERSPLQSIQWFRVVLDEAHYIKTASTVASRASCAVDADRRIALTGTPIQNKIEDIWALFRFLRMKPFDEKSMFTDQISKPCKIGDAVGVARLQVLMGSCTLRRTKDSTAEDGRKILNLPARKEVQLWLDLREDERAIYEDRKAQGQAELREYNKADKGDRNYAHVLQQLLRLRQTCNHIDLPQMDPVEEDYEGTIMDYEVAVNGINLHGLTQNRGVSVVCFMKDSESAVCSECSFDYNDCFPPLAMAGMEEAKPKKKLTTPLLLTKCLHVYCPKCFKGSVHPGWSKRMKEPATRACGICQTMLKLPADVAEIVPPDSAEALVPVEQPKEKRKRYVRPPGEKPNLSTKMQYLYNELIQSSKRNPNSKNYDPYALAMSDEIEDVDQDGKPYLVKSVIFSQWTTMLDRIGDMLDEAQIRYARLDGTMTREDRAKACDDLKYNKKVEILLVSTRAGGVGLNLTTASRCFLVDPNWNPSVEAQAIDRIHRMGQTRPVQAIKLMIKDSVEEKLDKLQRKKANLAKMSLNNLTSKELLEQKKEEMAQLFS